MEEELEDQDFLDVLEVNDDLMKDMYSKEKRTPPIMLLNEKAVIIAKRVKHLNNGQ